LFYRSFSSSREYGDPEDVYDGEVVGFVLDDTLANVTTGTAVFATTANASSNVGLHAINGSGLAVTNGNYQLTILQETENATALEITPAQLTYVADLATRIYSDVNPTFVAHRAPERRDARGDRQRNDGVYDQRHRDVECGRYDISGGR
jgi:hypothetical protein